LCKQILRDAKLKTGNRGQKTELTLGSPLKRQRSDWTVVPFMKEEEEKKMI
jgi:hypothetical protein